jgi:uncharacterized membrane protein
VVTVVGSWGLVNTAFAFKYARLYYVDEDGGIYFRRRIRRSTATSPTWRSRSA